MALQPAFFTGPPPPVVRPTLLPNNNVVYGINPDMSRWIQNLWNWTVKFGNNADGAASFSGSISIGTSPNWFKADASGIWLGGTTFAAATFSVSMAGAVKGTSGTIGGWTLSSTKLSSTTIDIDPVYGFSMTLNTGASAVNVRNDGSPAGYFETRTDSVSALSGYAYNNTVATTGVGVSGTSNAPAGKGVVGDGRNGAHGVYGTITSGGGYSVYAASTMYVGGAATFNSTINGMTPASSGTMLTTTSSAGSFPTLNQNTSGSAATLTTARNIGGTSFNGSASIDCIQTKHAGDNSICSFTGSPGATTYPLAYTVGKSASGGAIPALNRNADDGGTMGWYWLKVWSGSQFIYMPYMA